MPGARPNAAAPAAGVSVVSDTAASGRPELRFLTCGSVDDGKSTLVGRLLYDSNLVLEDQLAAAANDSRKVGTTGDEIDLALLLDGLQAEREQGITIDVAYRYFATPRRKFIVADTPGHEQYTRNMATGASNCDLAVILVDVRKGVLKQTRRHSSIANLLGIRHVVLAVNKMDLIDFAQQRFADVAADYVAFARELGIADIVCIPVSARHGDNLFYRSSRMSWYAGPTLMDHLETVDVRGAYQDLPFRMPVQWINRPHADFRGFAGTIASGTIGPGEEIAVLPSGLTSRVKAIHTYDGTLPVAGRGRAVALVLDDEIDISRGDVIVAPRSQPNLSDQFAADIIWMGQEPMLPGRPYLFKCGTQTVTGFFSALKHKLNVENLDKLAGKELELNDIGFCNISTSRPIVFSPYQDNRTLGGFIVIDRLTNATVGAGLIRFELRRAGNLHWQALDLNKVARSRALGQKPLCLWFTGLSGAGKSTIANLVEQRLHLAGRHTYLLDGDNVRHGLNRDLGFTEADRVENIRRIAEVARLMVDAGLIVITSFISPFRAERQMARELFGDGEFVEIFVDTPLAECERRDPKGLYRKARAGGLANFTGISSPYEPPQSPDLHLRAGEATPEQLAEQVIAAVDRFS